MGSTVRPSKPGTPTVDTGIFPLAGPEPATISPAELRANPSAVVVDLSLSRRHREGHIPGAWFAIRARLAQALDKLPASGDLVLTSEDGAIARFAAAEMRTRRPVKVLAGGTAAWKAAGLPLETGMERLADEPDDVSLSARDRRRPTASAICANTSPGRSTSSTRSPATAIAASVSRPRRIDGWGARRGLSGHVERFPFVALAKAGA